jgi:predicted ATP-dependent endonuclease of OLD family
VREFLEQSVPNFRQTFLLSEARRLSGDPRQQLGTKCFFMITHSPYFLDIRTITELCNCILFQPGKPPTAIDSLDSQDEFLLKRLLPRLNTHHKQFFFSTRPIFVEGYTDQQMFTLIQESRGRMMGATGACFIDVSGNEEQDVFFRLCRRLSIQAQFISDLDVVTQGRFRDSISGIEDEGVILARQ